MNHKEQRDTRGRFLVGNAGGGRSMIPPELLSKGPKAWAKIFELMEHAGDEGIQLKAAIWIAERIYNKARQEIELATPDLTPAARALLAMVATPIPKDVSE